MANVSEIPDAELIRRAMEVMCDKRRGRGWQPLWVSVSDQFLLGSTYSAQLCRRFGFDPERQVRP